MRTNSKLCYIGTRVSTAKQAQQGDSLADQELVCTLAAEKRGLSTLKVFSAQHSATKEGDSFIDDIVEEIKRTPISQRAAWFIIKSIDRFCRAGSGEYFKLKNELEKLGVQLVDVNGIIQPKINTLEHLGLEFKWSKVSPSEGSEIAEAHGAKKEVSAILTRMIGEEIVLVRQGYKVRRPDDGFLNEKRFVENKKRVVMVPDQERAQFFIKMFEMRASGAYTDAEIVKHVNAMGYRSKVQNLWSKDKKTVIGQTPSIKLDVKQLQKVIKRPVYCAINTEKWLPEPIKSKSVGLVSVDVFNAANKGAVFIEEKKDGTIVIHNDYNPHQLKRMKNNPLFPHKEVVLCPMCRKPFRGSTSIGKSGKGFPTYHCCKGHKHYGVNKLKFEESLTALVSGLTHKNENFIRSLEATLTNKFLEKEKELGEFSVKVGTNVIELETQKMQKINSYTSTNNEIIKAELEKQINKLHAEIEEARMERNSIEVQEDDVHAFIGYVKELMEHPVEMLVKQEDATVLKGLFSLVFDELPTYEEIVNGTPKLSLPYKLADEFRNTKSLSVNTCSVTLNFYPITWKCR